ncbi:phosphatidate cytidylyltransferase [Legionella dresdenensis]|uniref:Phosphatidate cytidylyltransferase n=1 Tax=Legionella dresdenensis TaxID=450200 RepID=A0ABV8CHB2_9GAMM
MFIQRLLTTLILLPLVLVAIYYADSRFFSYALLVLALGCAYEWLQLIPIRRIWLKAFFLGAVAAAWVLVSNVYCCWLATGIAVWGLILIAICSYPKLQKIWGHKAVTAFLCLLLLPLFTQSMSNIFSLTQGKALVIYLLFLVWGADIGGYLAGKLLGKHKLIPAVSPGKTVEGVAGGIVLSLLVSLAASYYFQPLSLLKWTVAAFGIALVSLVGDLFVSMLKRRTQIKDTGHLLPGHGGVLDRLDSLIAAAPFFYLAVNYI